MQESYWTSHAPNENKSGKIFILFFYKIGWKKLFQRTAANNKDFVIYYLVTSQSEHLIPTEVAIFDETML